MARLPADPAGHAWTDASLHVQATEQRLGIHEHGLDLDDEQNALHQVEGKNVDSPTVPVSIEAHLASDGPPAFLQAIRPKGQGGMIRIQEPVDLLPLPANVPVERQIHRRRDRSRGADGQPARVSAFKKRAGGAADVCRRCEIDQPPTAPMSTCANRLAEATIVHAPIMRPECLPPAYRRLTLASSV